MNERSQPTRAVIIYNPAAGQATAMEHALQEACAVWQAAHWQVELRPTSGPGDATELAREAAAQGYDIAVAAGGDGTVNEVVNGLVGTHTALGALPVGTVNIWAREVGIPLQPRAAAEALLQAERHTIDLGRAGERYFLLMASLGFDAAVTGSVRSDEKRRLGALAYVLEGLRVAFRFQGVRARLMIDGKRLHGRYLMIVIGNTQLYGGLVKLTAHATIDDGLLDVCLIKGRTLRGAPLRMWSILRRRYSADPHIAYYRARSVSCATSKPFDVQVDGDHIGSTPMKFTIAPGALQVLIPPKMAGALLKHEHAPEDMPVLLDQADQQLETL